MFRANAKPNPGGKRQQASDTGTLLRLEGVWTGRGVEGHLPAAARIMTPRELPAAKSDLYHPAKYQNQIVNKLVKYQANAPLNNELLSPSRFYLVWIIVRVLIT